MKRYFTFFCLFCAISNLFAQGSWTQKIDFPGSVRYGSFAFSISNKGYVGTGIDANGNYYYADFWEYNPLTNTWTQKADFGGGVRASAVGFSIGNKGYAGTGEGGGPMKKDFWEYNPLANAWVQKTDFGGVGRNGAVGFSIGAKGYIGTGYGGGYKKDFWEYDTTGNAWTQKTDFGGVARDFASGFSINGKGYIGTGENGTLRNDFWEYDTTSNTWTQKANFGGGAKKGAIGFSIGIYGYMGTGQSSNTFWKYNPASDTWTQQTNFGGTGRDWAVGLSISGKGYVGTGVNGLTHFNDFWEFNPAPVPSVCIVTVDTFANKNKIVWEELADPQVVSYNIYKETTTAGIYALVGNVPHTSLSTFTDNSSNPMQVAARYKLSSVDTFGNESAQSVNHKTIHLVVSLGIPPAINLQWDGYEGITFGKYRIWRGSQCGNLSLIDSVQSTLTSYTDINPPAGTNFYAIQIVYSQGCVPARFSSTASVPFTNSISNVPNTGGVTGTNDYYSNSLISTYPNPSSGIFRINGMDEKSELKIYNVQGEKIYQSIISNPQTEIDISSRPAGVYFLQVTTNEGVMNKKIILRK